jgi:hypothetical protein
MNSSVATETSRFLAAITLLALILTTIIALLPIAPATNAFAVGPIDCSVKLLLAAALGLITFIGRPRLMVVRRSLGSIAALTLLFAAIGAYTSQLGLGDAVLLFFGALISTLESLELQAPATETDVFTVLSRN